MSDTETETFAGPTKAQLEAQLAEERRIAAESAEPEPEPDDDGPEDEDEDDPDDEPVATTRALSEKDIERINRRIDAAAVANEKRLRDILRDDFDVYAPCPLCAIPGFAYKPGTLEYEPLHRAAIMAALGDAPEIEYKPDPKTQACPACDGLGDVRTGSKREAAALKGCDSCGGTGWVPKLDPQQQYTGSGGTVLPGNFTGSVFNVPPTTIDHGDPYPGFGIAFVPIPGGSPDGFGRPAGHPHYGLPREYSEQAS